MPSGFAAAPECPKTTKKALVGETIMYDHDSGWELGTLLTHHVVYHVDFHGATSHMENHVGKLDNLNHDRNHVVIHVVFYNANQTS